MGRYVAKRVLSGFQRNVIFVRPPSVGMLGGAYLKRGGRQEQFSVVAVLLTGRPTDRLTGCTLACVAVVDGFRSKWLFSLTPYLFSAATARRFARRSNFMCTAASSSIEWAGQGGGVGDRRVVGVELACRFCQMV